MLYPSCLSHEKSHLVKNGPHPLGSKFFYIWCFFIKNKESFLKDYKDRERMVSEKYCLGTRYMVKLCAEYVKGCYVFIQVMSANTIILYLFWSVIAYIPKVGQKNIFSFPLSLFALRWNPENSRGTFSFCFYDVHASV